VQPGQGIIGTAFSENRLQIKEKNDITEDLLPFGLPESGHLRAIAAVPVPASLADNPETVEAVYCYDFVDKIIK